MLSEDKHILCPMVLSRFRFPTRMKYRHFVHMRHFFTLRNDIYCIARLNGSISWNSVATKPIFFGKYQPQNCYDYGFGDYAMNSPNSRVTRHGLEMEP